MKNRLKGFAGVAAAGILSLVVAPQAHATLYLTLFNGSSCVVGPSCVTVNDTLSAGLASYNGKVGNFSVNVTTGVGQNVPPSLDLNSVDKTTIGGAGKLT